MSANMVKKFKPHKKYIRMLELIKEKIIYNHNHIKKEEALDAQA
jgi:hypothetical protein